MYFYLRDVLSFSNCLTEKQIKELFLRILKDYFENNIDISALSDLSSLLLFEITNPSIVNGFNDDLFAEALDFAADVRYYAENQNLGENRKTYKESMKVIKDYYKQNKKLIKNLDFYVRNDGLFSDNNKFKTTSYKLTKTKFT